MKQRSDWLARAGAALLRVLLNPILLFAVALVSGIIGAAIALDGPRYAARLAQAERLFPVHAPALADAPEGREVLLEGRISAENATVYRSFVTYVREEYRSRSSDWLDDTDRWVEVERVTPPLLIALPDGAVRIANTDYSFDSTAVTVREAEPTFSSGAVQSRGYTVDDTVLVIGRVMGNRADRAVQAEFLYAGTHAAYTAEMRRLAEQSLPIGALFLLVCGISTAAGVWQVRLFLHEVRLAQEQTQEREARTRDRRTRGRRR